MVFQKLKFVWFRIKMYICALNSDSQLRLKLF